MKIFIVFVLMMFSVSSFATVNTLRLSDEYSDGDSTLCVYSNGHRTETVSISYGSCPTFKTFD